MNALDKEIEAVAREMALLRWEEGVCNAILATPEQLSAEVNLSEVISGAMRRSNQDLHQWTLAQWNQELMRSQRTSEII